MAALRPAALAAASLLGAILASCHAPGGRTMSYADYRQGEHTAPYVLEISQGDSRLVYYGAAHFSTPDDPQAADVERRWDALHPDFALNEGGDPPVEATREIALGRHGEPGLLRWLAHRDGVTIRSLDPTQAEEVAALRTDDAPTDLKLFYILRAVMQDAQRAPEYRAPTPEAGVENSLRYLTTIAGLEGPPATLAEFESLTRRRAPDLIDWRRVPPEWFDPALKPPPAFTNPISRAMSRFRDRYIVDVLDAALKEHKRAFAVVGASHVVMQEPELRRRFDAVAVLPAHAIAPGVSRDVVSLLGKTLEPPPIPEARREELARKLIGYSERAAKPEAAEDDFIWLGRTLAYLHRYRDAIDAFTRGLAKYPDSYRLLRHRGHRFITIRDLDSAQKDLERAESLIRLGHVRDEVEPDGVPNRSGIPRSTTNTNIYYHIGLVYYLRGEFGNAAREFRRCLEISPNDDMTVAAANWAYLSLCREGLRDEDRALLAARVHPGMQILENDAYFRLCRMYQGEMAPEAVLPVDPSDEIGLATVGYGVATWHILEGREQEGRALLERVASSPMWPSFGVIAAEAELARAQQKH